jgi:hypothetical protein
MPPSAHVATQPSLSKYREIDQSGALVLNLQVQGAYVLRVNARQAMRHFENVGLPHLRPVNPPVGVPFYW